MPRTTSQRNAIWNGPRPCRRCHSRRKDNRTKPRQRPYHHGDDPKRRRLRFSISRARGLHHHSGKDGVRQIRADPGDAGCQPEVATRHSTEGRDLATTVEATAVAPIVESGTASVGMTIDTRQVTELPLNTRRFGSLPLLMAGTVPDRGGFSNNIFGSPFSAVTYASNGLRGSGTNVLIDEVDSKNMLTGGFSIRP